MDTCRKCNEREATYQLKIVGLRLSETWPLCDVCQSMVCSLLAGRPVYQRGITSKESHW